MTPLFEGLSQHGRVQTAADSCKKELLASGHFLSLGHPINGIEMVQKGCCKRIMPRRNTALLVPNEALEIICHKRTDKVYESYPDSLQLAQRTWIS